MGAKTTDDAGWVWTTNARTASRSFPPGGPHAAGVSGTVGACTVPMRGKRSPPDVCPICVSLSHMVYRAWHKTSVVSPEICDTLIPGNSRIALPLFGEFCVTQAGRSLTTSRPTTSTLWRERGPPRMCALRHAWTARDVLRRWGARAPRSRSAARQAGLDRPTARHTRGGHGRPNRASGSLLCDCQGHRRYASRVSKRCSAIMRSAGRATTRMLVCPALHPCRGRAQQRTGSQPPPPRKSYTGGIPC